MKSARRMSKARALPASRCHAPARLRLTNDQQETAMRIPKIVAALLLPLGVTAAAVTQAEVYIYDANTVPARLVEVVPSQTYTYMYRPGYYSWDGTRYVWIGEQLTPGYQRWAYVPGTSGTPEIGANPQTFLH